jgi:hypothetical protein
VGLIGSRLVKNATCFSRQPAFAIPSQHMIMQGAFLQIDAHSGDTCLRHVVKVRSQTIEKRMLNRPSPG